MNLDEPRWVDLCPALEKQLSAYKATLPNRKQRGRVVAEWREEEYSRKWKDDADRVLRDLQDACPEIERKKISYNGFRHTFGSLLAKPPLQTKDPNKGAPLWPAASVDYICAQLGNTSAVARQHYIDLAGSTGTGPAHRMA